MIFISGNGKAPDKWIPNSDALWTGPSSMKSKTAIHTCYPSLQKFFQTSLRIPNAGPEVLVDELQAISDKWAGKVIAPDVKSDVTGLLLDMSDLVETTNSSEWIDKLFNFSCSDSFKRIHFMRTWRPFLYT